MSILIYTKKTLLYIQTHKHTNIHTHTHTHTQSHWYPILLEEGLL